MADRLNGLGMVVGAVVGIAIATALSPLTLAALLAVKLRGAVSRRFR